MITRAGARLRRQVRRAHYRSNSGGRQDFPARLRRARRDAGRVKVGRSHEEPFHAHQEVRERGQTLATRQTPMSCVYATSSRSGHGLHRDGLSLPLARCAKSGTRSGASLARRAETHGRAVEGSKPCTGQAYPLDISQTTLLTKEGRPVSGFGAARRDLSSQTRRPSRRIPGRSARGRGRGA